MFTFLLACGSPPEPVDAPDVEPSPAIDPLVEADELLRWRAADGWYFQRAVVLGDVTGDGIADAAVAVHSAEEARSLVVAGPLRREVVLPGDELSAHDRLPYAGDTDGDGRLELLDPRDAWLVDVDGDGVLDYLEGQPDAVAITWGPRQRWTGVADLVLETTCATYDDAWIEELVPLPDLDGDGRRELWVSAYGFGCGGALVPLPDDGVHVVDLGDDQWWSAPIAVDDQTGDGLPDLMDELDLPRRLYQPSWTGHDLDADGYTDFVAIVNEFDGRWGSFLAKVRGGPGGFDVAPDRGWNVPGVSFETAGVWSDEQGVAMLAADGDQLFVIDLRR